VASLLCLAVGSISIALSGRLSSLPAFAEPVALHFFFFSNNLLLVTPLASLLALLLGILTWPLTGLYKLVGWRPVPGGPTRGSLGAVLGVFAVSMWLVLLTVVWTG
jgi:hypothetical protein